MNSCARCSREVSGGGFVGSDGVTVYCGSGCRREDEIEVAAALMAAQLDKKKRK